MLTADLPKEGLKSGDVGTVVHIHGGGAAYEVEFMTFAGKTIAVATVDVRCPPCWRTGRQPRPRIAVSVIAFVFLRLNV